MINLLISEENLLLLPHKDKVRFALFCAEQIRGGWKHIPTCVLAIEMVERWLEGKATAQECSDAAHYASVAASAYIIKGVQEANAAYITAYAAYAAAYPMHASHNVANAVTAVYNVDIKLIDVQRNYYNELLHFDDIAEKLLLGGVL